MCLAVPAKISSIDDDYAYVENMGIRQKINIQLIGSPNIGDYVLIHAGFAIEKIDIDRYNFINETFKEMIEGIKNE